MAVDINRWRDIVLAPCNASAERRNWAAARDALEALANDSNSGGSSSAPASELKFFRVLTSAVGSPSCSVVEVLYDAGDDEWKDSGGTFDAYDWTPTEAFRKNFVQGYYGIGRTNAAVGAQSLEVLAIEGPARFIQATATENMDAGEVNATVTAYWGDPLNGRDPGGTVTVHDNASFAASIKNGDKLVAVWDEKLQEYVLISPTKQTDSAALIQITGNECDSSLLKNVRCLYDGVQMSLASGAFTLGNMCGTNVLSQGTQVWVYDARKCRSIERIPAAERFIGYKLHDAFTAQGSTRPLYAIVDQTATFRWFHIVSNADAIAFAREPNAFRCRDCDEDEVADDSPSMYARWVDVIPCDFGPADVPDDSIQLIYFPMHWARCLDVAAKQQLGLNDCDLVDADPDCRVDSRILCYWNLMSERWEAVADVEKCTNKNSFAAGHIYVCKGEVLSECCVFDAIKIDYQPFNDSYCYPIVQSERVFVRCSNGDTSNLPIGYCKIGIKICNSFECTWMDNGVERTEKRPVYQFDCGNCEGCRCPPVCAPVFFKWRSTDPMSDCGSLIDGVAGTLHCVDANPVNDPESPPVPGWWGTFCVSGLEPALLYRVDGTVAGLTGTQDLMVELDCSPDSCSSSVATGNIVKTYLASQVEAGNMTALGAAVTYTSGIYGCYAVKDANGGQVFKSRDYLYGIFVQCNASENDSFNGAELFWLKNGAVAQTAGGTPIGGGTPDESECQQDCEFGTVTRLLPPASALIGDGDVAAVTTCCGNSVSMQFQTLLFECSEQQTIPIAQLANVTLGQGEIKVCPSCIHDGYHVFLGCDCLELNEDCNATPTPATCAAEAADIWLDLTWNPGPEAPQ